MRPARRECRECENHHSRTMTGALSLADIIYRGDFNALTDEEAIRLLNEQYGSEIARLKRVAPNIEQGDDDNPPSGNLTPEALTPSRLLFQEDFCEVNRTLVNFLALRWLLADDYPTFTAHQPEAVKLTQETFQSLRQQTFQILESPGHLLALIVLLVLGDVGKDPKLADEVTARDGKVGNHDEVIEKAVELGLFSTPLNVLPSALRESVLLAIKVGTELNIPQLTQGENVPGSLQSILLFRGHEQAFNLKYPAIIFDVAGAGGHIDACGATRMIEPVCQSFLLAWPVLRDVIAGNLSLRGAYDQVLQHRGQSLAEQGFKRLSTDTPSNWAFLRLCAMGRVADQHTAGLFDRAFRSIPHQTRQDLIDGLNVDGYDDGQAVTLYYMPGLLAEALRVIRDAPEQKWVEALQSLMSFMARTYGGSKPQPGQQGSIVECDISPAKEVVCDPRFRDNPTILDQYNLPIF